MITDKKQYIDVLKYEKDNYYNSYPIFTRELKKILKYQKLLRKIEYYTNCRKDIVGKIYLKKLNIKFEKLSIKYGFHIPINTIDRGLCIIHTGPIYINDNCKIGKNFRIHPMTTIGKNIGRSMKSPKIGDNVWVGPGSRIYGDIELGDNVVVGTNSVVGNSFKGSVTIAGVPAKVISNKGYRDYFN